MRMPMINTGPSISVWTWWNLHLKEEGQCRKQKKVLVFTIPRVCRWT